MRIIKTKDLPKRLQIPIYHESGIMLHNSWEVISEFYKKVMNACGIKFVIEPEDQEEIKSIKEKLSRKIIPTANIKANHILAKDILVEDNVVLDKGTVLDEVHRYTFLRLGVGFVYVEKNREDKKLEQVRVYFKFLKKRYENRVISHTRISSGLKIDQIECETEPKIFRSSKEFQERRYSILIADDEPHIRKITRIFLEGEGYRVEEASNKLETFKLLNEQNFDLLLLDTIISQKTIRNILESSETLKMREKTPVVMFTASMNNAKLIKALNAGVSDFILKPFKKDTLVSKVGWVLSKTYST